MVDVSPAGAASSIGLNLNGFSWNTIAGSVPYFIAIILLVLVGGGYLIYYYNKRTWTRVVTLFELIGDAFEPTFRDVAKPVKLGKGGFEVIFWKKAKVYKIASGRRIGRNAYYFFRSPDGYDYNGVLGRYITSDGKVPIIASSSQMRASYTSLEKMIEALHGEQTKFWDKYGTWIMSIGFVLIIGIMAYLTFGEYSKIMGQMPALVDKMAQLTDNINKLLVSSSARTGSTLTTGT